MFAMVFPEKINVVHQSMIPVEPEVEDDIVEPNLKR